MIFLRMFFQPFGRVGAILLASIGLAGCYDVDATLTFKPDGTAAMTSRIDFPRDAKYVADLYKAVMALNPAMSRFFDEGLCHSVEKFAAAAPQKTFEIKAHEYTTDKRFGCGFLYEAGDTAALIDKLKSAPAATSNVLKIWEVAPRRVRIELDFNNMQGVSKMMPGLIMLGAMKYGTPGQGLPNMEAVNKISKTYVDASLAVARMSAANNHLQFTIKARKVIDTNGKRDGDLVKFRWSWERFTRLMLKPSDGNPSAKVFYAVVEY
jgi:hypothetical protein